jgi:predicted nucleic acid-binding protein
VYIGAARNRAALDAFKGFVRAAERRTRFLAPVWLELQAGIRDDDEQEILDALVEPYVRSDRMVTPSRWAFQQAGRLLQDLASKEGAVLADTSRSLYADILIAVTAREIDAILVTENAKDFARIQRHLRGFRYVEPYP